jgi:SMI1 / KNR4 family (SUKH-1)
MAWRDNPPATTEHLLALSARAAPIVLPTSYLNSLAGANGGEGDLTLPGEAAWLQLWSAETVLDRHAAYEVGHRFPGLLAIASDGGGELFAFDTRSGAGRPYPIVKIPAISVDWVDLLPVAPDWDSFELGFGLEEPRGQ